MTKKHLKALAAAIADIKDLHERIRTSIRIGEVCETFNSRFDWVLWHAACQAFLPEPKKTT